MAAKGRKGGLGRGLGALIPTTDARDVSDVLFGTKRGGAPEEPMRREAEVSRDSDWLDRVETAFDGDRKTQKERKPAGSSTATDKPSPTTRPRVQKSVAEQKVEAGQAIYSELPVGQIAPNPKNPRQEFDPDGLKELAHSISEFGLMQPVVVRPVARDQYELIMGERRLRAAQLAGLDRIPAIVRLAKDEDMLRDALIENIHRIQLNPLEEAAAYQQMLEEFGITQEQLAAKLGRSRPVISNTIRILGLPLEVQRKVAAGVLSNGHARALLGVKVEDTAAAQEALAARIVAEGLSVRATEEAVTLLNGGKAKQASKKARILREVPERMQSVANSLEDILDTKVDIQMGRKKGRLIVSFADPADFERISAILEKLGK